ncbi:O-antigen translocase [Salmonella bongori]|uniref:O-antigen translocase n=1 Tax=Salmonella bongori TaxID=54736 RepID=UPI0009AAE554|nr:O-antigen translocase [Salmonella bongori]EDP8630014.1 O-antigen translocase [Salmonella bongori]EDP8647530.1 O-antigen translocase [Salmonella bongori]EDP8660335.1 O-antigen translocase [Salmonella bongori]EIU0396154.1 O-antigen translocase [Salmonella bongori]HAB1661921.1 oligosaccharide flippase family protein [Salmonella bongori]
MKKILSVTTFTGMLTLLRMAAGFLMAKVIAIYLGPTGMAMLGQVQNIVAILNGLITAPVSPALIRYTAENFDGSYLKCSPWWRASLGWVLIFILILIPVFYISSDILSLWLFGSDQYSYLIKIIALCLPVSVVGIIINAINNGLQHYKKYVLWGMVSVIISTSVMILLVIYKNVDGALLAISIQNAIIGFVLLILSINEPWLKFKYWVGKIDKTDFLCILRYILMALTSALALPIALLLLRNTLVDNVGWNLTGQWQAVWKVSDAYLAVMTLALSTYYLPILSKTNTLKQLKQEIKNVAKVIIPITIVLSSVIYVFREFIIRLLFTDSFNEAESLFLLQLIGDNIKIIAWLYAYPLIAYGIAKWYIIAEIAFAFVFISLGHFFVLYYGVDGANIAYLCAYIFYFIFTFILVNKVIPYSKLR